MLLKSQRHTFTLQTKRTLVQFGPDQEHLFLPNQRAAVSTASISTAEDLIRTTRKVQSALKLFKSNLPTQHNPIYKINTESMELLGMETDREKDPGKPLQLQPAHDLRPPQTSNCPDTVTINTYS